MQSMDKAVRKKDYLPETMSPKRDQGLRPPTKTESLGEDDIEESEAIEAEMRALFRRIHNEAVKRARKKLLKKL